ncbi:TPA: prophage tail fiber N-terminal domain-containing protein [Salmonella enterica]|nr:prophage tail fiber N-terminal domain-containing protein [Salmonella enterica]
MPQLKGVIKTPTGEPLGGATITLTSLHNRAGIVKGVFSHVTTQSGEYNFSVLPGVYSVRLTQRAQRLSEIGVIRVYEDSKDGSLNDFLGATDIDLRPEALKKFEELAQQAQQGAQEAGKHAADAEAAKEDVQKLANDVQQNAQATAADRKATAEHVKQSGENAALSVLGAQAAASFADAAEQAKNEIDVTLAGTLKTANHLSEIAAEGAKAQQESRDSLGLKSAATMEPQSDIRDRTADRLAIPGAFGFGHMFLPGELIRADSEKDLLAWVKQATPGEYCVQGATGVLPGGPYGVITIRFLEANRYPPEPPHTAKAVIFYSVNGDVYYNRYWPLSGGYLVGWENLKTNENYFLNLIRARAPLYSPVLTGTPKTPTPPDNATGTEIANAAFVRKLLAGLVGSSPEALDTLNELAAALGNDPNFAATVTNALADKQPLNAVLTAISNLTQRANNLLYFDADEDAALAPLSEKARSLLSQETPEAMRTVLGLKSAATMEPQSHMYDRTEGRLAIPGAFGYGTPIYTRTDFKTATEFADWAQKARPGRYLVYANPDVVIPNVLFSGELHVSWLEKAYPQTRPEQMQKGLLFYGINGHIYYARCFGTNWTTLQWINLRVAEEELSQYVLRKLWSTIGGPSGDPGVGGLILAAYQGIDSTDDNIELTRGKLYPGSRLTVLSVSVQNDDVSVTTSVPEITTRGCTAWSLPGSYVALNGSRGNARGKAAMVGMFIRAY